MASLFPAFLKLEGRKCVIVGAGRIAEQKLHGLLASGARVIAIAEQASETFHRLADEGRMQLVLRSFQPGDVNGAVLVIAATGNRDVNQEIFVACSARAVLCNAVDEPERCHFYYPAVVRRGDLQIAISTNGKSPALAQRIRAELEKQFGDEYAEWLVWLGTVRELLFRLHVEPDRRRSLLHRIASQRVYDGFRLFRTRRQKEAVHG